MIKKINPATASTAPMSIQSHIILFSFSSVGKITGVGAKIGAGVSVGTADTSFGFTVGFETGETAGDFTGVFVGSVLIGLIGLSIGVFIGISRGGVGMTGVIGFCGCITVAPWPPPPPPPAPVVGGVTVFAGDVDVEFTELCPMLLTALTLKS